jgi:hypothetical protein
VQRERVSRDDSGPFPWLLPPGVEEEEEERPRAQRKQWLKDDSIPALMCARCP